MRIIFAAVEKLVRPPSPPRHEIVTTMGKVANIRHCVTTTGFHIGVKLFMKSPLLRFSLFNFFGIDYREFVIEFGVQWMNKI